MREQTKHVKIAIILRVKAVGQDAQTISFTIHNNTHTHK